ncbi:MAG: PKD domain-containing protein [Bacteroidota bacterium]
MASLLPFFVSAQITTFPYFEDFDSGPGGWVPNIGGINGWTHGTPAKPVISAAASAPNCWVTGSLTGNYADNSSAFVESPEFDFSNLNNPHIAFSVFWELEANFDGVALAASTDSGATWNVVGGFLDPVAWYNNQSIVGGFLGGPCGQSLGWSGRDITGNGSQQWLPAQHALNGLANEPSVRLRFCLGSDFGNTYDGFAFDDVVIADAPFVDLGPDTVICFADTLILQACSPSAVSYLWSTSPVDTLCTKVAVASNQYIVIVEDSLGFVVRDTLNLTVSPTFVNLPQDQIICPGDTLILDAGNPTANHVWEPGPNNSQFFDVTQSGKYKVTVSDNFGCVVTDSIDVILDILPNIDLGEDTTICVGQSLLLDAGAGNPGTTYLWNVGASTTQTIFVSAPNQYIVDVTTAGNCQISDTIDVDVSLTPVVDLGDDRVECGEFTLDALNPGNSYLWSNNQVTQQITTQLPGTYWVVVTNPFGCQGSDTVNINQGAAPLVNLGPDQVICNGSSVSFDLGNPGATYFWSTGETTQTITVSQPGIVIGQVENSDGCIRADTVNVLLSPLQVDLGPDKEICEGDSTLLDAGATGTTYIWSTGQQFNPIYITTAGQYIVTVSDVAGCVAKDTILITSKSDFTPDFTLPDSAELYQSVQFTDLTGSVANNWSWDFGDGNTSNQQNPSHTYQSINNFTVCLTASNGVCINTVCKQIEVTIFTNLEEELGLEWDLYPNPATQQATLDIQLEQARELGWQLLDMQGQVIQQKALGRQWRVKEELALGSLASGMYLIALEIDGYTLHKKLVVR